MSAPLSPQDALCSAAENDDVGGIQSAMLLGADVNKPGVAHLPNVLLKGRPLEIAAGNNNVAAVEALLQIPGIEVNFLNAFDTTPLLEACKGGISFNIHRRYASVKLLLEAGAIPRKLKPTCEPALHVAIRHGSSQDVNLLRLLVSNGADVNERSCSGETLLGQAVGRGNPADIRMLLELGCDPNAKLAGELTAVQIAQNFGMPDCVDVFNTYAAEQEVKQGIENGGLPSTEAGSNPSGRRRPNIV